MEDALQIAFWLKQLGQDTPDTFAWEKLTGGVSGSSTYRVILPTEPVILKAANADCPGYVRERARREIAFYRSPTLAAPLSVPHVLATYDVPEIGCALLLRAYAPAKGAPAWNREEYLEMANQLACFHARFWNRPEIFSAHVWLRPLPTEDLSFSRQQALAAWQKLQHTHPQAFANDAEAFLAHALERAIALKQSVDAFPLTLCHNDCHSGNLLRDGTRLLWADWQEVGPGQGPNDLSFFYQRADTPPDLTVARAYHERLEQETGEPVPFEAIWRVMVSSELWTRLIHWPHYLIDAPIERVVYHLQRIQTLLESA